MHDLIVSLFSSWTPVVYTDEFLNWFNNYLVSVNPSEVSLPWPVFIDWHFLAGAVCFVVILFSLFKLLGVILKR